jgi:hypothetical protein
MAAHGPWGTKPGKLIDRGVTKDKARTVSWKLRTLEVVSGTWHFILKTIESYEGFKE